MCLLALAWKPQPGLRFVLASNRDEFHARPTLPLATWEEAPQILAGRDAMGGGTWLGVSTVGRLAAVTNVRLPSLPPALHSRGALAADFLRSPRAPATHHVAIQPTLDGYSPCNLLIADTQEARYLSNQPGVSPRLLQPGLYGLSNAALDTPWPKVLRLKAALHRWLHRGSLGDLEPLFTALASREVADDAALPDTGVGLARERLLAPAFIIAGPEYGTRCSTVVWVCDDGSGGMVERRFGPEGVSLGETRLAFRWPTPAPH